MLKLNKNSHLYIRSRYVKAIILAYLFFAANILKILIYIFIFLIIINILIDIFNLYIEFIVIWYYNKNIEKERIIVAYRVISKCPVCNSKLKIAKLRCSKCSTVIENDFEFSKFEYLNEEYLNFMEVFLKCRGNIKDVEKELGISYPTVRAKLDEVVSALGYSVVKKPTVGSKEILDMLEKGEISAEQAVNMMKED
nr:DUF2089 domain-containing protein [Clostridium sp. A1-XYC3]